MSPEPTILPTNEPPAPPAPPIPDPSNPTREIRCEFCACKLDRKGRVLERGAKVREMIEAEDTIAELRKQLKASQDAHETTRGELSATRAELAPLKARKFGSTL